ncbi:MAG: glutamate-cysteine ligase family protein, partial [Bacteroidota bacterium]|nr:glutamate-cysteine ligase family protein [Bacteroidota bacterium]
MEIQLLDHLKLELTPRADDIMALVKNKKLVKEMFRSTLELVTGVCKDVHEVDRDLNEVLQEVRMAGQKTGIRFSGTGTNPIANYNERILSRS